MKFFRTLMLVSLVVLWSCQEESSFTGTEGNDIVLDVSSTIDLDKDQLIDDFARVIAKSLEEKSFRQLVKDEASLQYDGDNNIFYQFLEQRELETDYKVKDHLLSNIHFVHGDLLGKNSVTVESWLAAIKNNYPDLQVAVPVHLESWDVENHIPLVTFLTDDFDEDKHKLLKAYDFKGNEYEISSEQEPELPVIVLSRSERVDGEGNLLYTEDEYVEIKPLKSETKTKVADGQRAEAFPAAPTGLNILPTGSSGQYVLSWTDVANEYKYQVMRQRPQDAGFQWIADLGANQNNLTTYIGPGARTLYIVRGLGTNSSGGIDHGPWSAPISTYGSDRVDGERLKMSRMYMSGSLLSDVESWAAGAPEIFIRIAIGNTTSGTIIYTSGKLEPGSRNDIKNKWWNKSVTMLNAWDVATFGTVLRINFIERDKSWATNQKIKISTQYEDKMDDSTVKFGVETEATINDSFKEFAEDAIFWWQARSFIYEQNGFKWQLSN